MIKPRLNLPWWKFYPADFGKLTQGWPSDAIVAYLDLCTYQFAYGELPVESADVRRLVSRGFTEAQWSTVWPYLDYTFPVVGDVRNSERFERQQQPKKRAKRQEAAAGAIEARWSKRAVVVLPKPMMAGVDETAWDAYQEHCRESKFDELTPRGLELLAIEFAKHPPQVQLAAVYTTIRSGWKGVFFEKASHEPANRVEIMKQRLQKWIAESPVVVPIKPEDREAS